MNTEPQYTGEQPPDVPREEKTYYSYCFDCGAKVECPESIRDSGKEYECPVCGKKNYFRDFTDELHIHKCWRCNHEAWALYNFYFRCKHCGNYISMLIDPTKPYKYTFKDDVLPLLLFVGVVALGIFLFPFVVFLIYAFGFMFFAGCSGRGR